MTEMDYKKAYEAVTMLVRAKRGKIMKEVVNEGGDYSDYVKGKLTAYNIIMHLVHGMENVPNLDVDNLVKKMIEEEP